MSAEVAESPLLDPLHGWRCRCSTQSQFVTRSSPNLVGCTRNGLSLVGCVVLFCGKQQATSVWTAKRLKSSFFLGLWWLGSWMAPCVRPRYYYSTPVNPMLDAGKSMDVGRCHGTAGPFTLPMPFAYSFHGWKLNCGLSWCSVITLVLLEHPYPRKQSLETCTVFFYVWQAYLEGAAVIEIWDFSAPARAGCYFFNKIPVNLILHTSL